MATVIGQHDAEPTPAYAGASTKCPRTIYADAEGAFEISVAEGISLERVLATNPYSAALAFINGEFEVEGDLCAAIRFFSQRRSAGIGSFTASCMATLRRMLLRFRPRKRAPGDIQFHYDRSNEFYQRFLDSRMQYSAGDFSNPDITLEEAQRAKLEGICTALRLRPGERFLDVGSGWGGLITYAAERFGVHAVGCTLSPHQRDFAAERLRRLGLETRVSVRRTDYRDLNGTFDKIASVGMFEHVGRARLTKYFRQIRSLLKRGGLFLNRGIVRPERNGDGPETLFIQTRVFPGGELVHLSDVVRAAGRAGLNVIRMDDFRQDYALTCKAWVMRLRENAEACRKLAGEPAYRTWLLYLAGSAVGFEDGTIDAAQVLFEAA